MRHDRGCICQQCASNSASDTLLVGVMVIAGVVIAITSASRVVVGLALAMLAVIIVRKLRATSPARGGRVSYRNSAPADRHGRDSG